jgi:hypothetical protein
MVRALLISLLFCVSVHANDIYVEQAEVNTESDKVALETKTKTQTGSTFQQPNSGTSFEKSLIVPTTTQYCSVVAGCYVKE